MGQGQPTNASKLAHRISKLRFMAVRYSALILLVGLQAGLSHCEEGLMATEGDIILGGMFPVHKKSESTENECGVFNEIPGYQYMEAMFFAVDQINKDPNILPNITIGTRICDSCQSITIATDCAKQFIKMTLEENSAKQLAGVVGAFSSGASEAVANFLRVFEIPQISYSSTSVTLSNKEIYSYFLRTVAPDSFQARAMVDLIKEFGWSYVATVNSEGTYGTKGMEVFWKNAEENDICIDSKIQLTGFPSTSEYRKIIGDLVKRSSKSNVSIVVFFCTQNDARNLLEAANVTQGAERFTWIGSDGWSNRVDVTETTGRAAQGALTIMVRRGEVRKEFKDYFTGLNWENYPRENRRYFKEFWESRFKCHPSELNVSQYKTDTPRCQGNEDLADVSIEFSPVRVVINAVYAFAHALDNLQKELCPNQTGICSAMSRFQRSRLLDHLKNVSFQDMTLNTTVKFDVNGEVNAMYDIMNFQNPDYVVVGSWDGELKDEKIDGQLKVDRSKIKWLKGSTSIPASYCSRECNLGAIRLQKPGFEFKCCWQCEQCEELRIIVNNTCLRGPEGWLPDVNRTRWVKREVLYPRWSDAPSLILIVISMVCLVLTLITLIIYRVHKDHCVVKASGRELCYVILVGISMCFLTPFLFIAKPNNPLCYVRNLVTGLALAMCYAPLFMKINRIYRIFTSAKSSVARPPLVTPRVQIMVTFALVSIQLMFTTLWFIAKPVRAMETYFSEEEELILECKVDQVSFSVNLCYVIVLMMLCTVYAFKTRNFPKNFNESKYIGIMMYTTCGIWITFFPFFLNTSYTFTHVYLISSACVLIGLITLTGLFAQKIYIVYYVSDIRSDDLVMTSSHKRSAAQGPSQMSEGED